MKKCIFIMVLMMMVMGLSFAQTPAPTEDSTLGPTPSYYLIWTRDIHVYDATDPENPPLAGVQVGAHYGTAVYAVTDEFGNCTVSIEAYENGGVGVTADLEGYISFSGSYPAKPPGGALSIGLEREPDPGLSAGDVWIVPRKIIVQPETSFSVEIHVNTGTARLASYRFGISHNPSLIKAADVDEGPDGFISAVGMGNPGYFIITGFDTSGTGPGSDLHVLTLHFTAYDTPGNTTINPEIDELINDNYTVIGNPRGFGGTVVITDTFIKGDVDYNGTVNIVDALLVAQFYVGLNPPSLINKGASDVNEDGTTTILDALLIAQFYVGIITEFPT